MKLLTTHVYLYLYLNLDLYLKLNLHLIYQTGEQVIEKVTAFYLGKILEIFNKIQALRFWWWSDITSDLLTTCRGIVSVLSPGLSHHT